MVQKEKVDFQSKIIVFAFVSLLILM